MWSLHRGSICTEVVFRRWSLIKGFTLSFFASSFDGGLTSVLLCVPWKTVKRVNLVVAHNGFLCVTQSPIVMSL